jgi:hypothetical protein
MTINYQSGDADAHRALICARAAPLEAGHRSIIWNALTAGDVGGSAGSVAGQSAGSNMASTDSAVGSSWA